MKVEVTWGGSQWGVRSEVAGCSHLQLVELKVVLSELVERIGLSIDLDTAEGQLKAEIGRRMGNLAGRAQAAGGLSDMWNNQQSRFYKERMAIQGMREAAVE